jgi:probable phosphoglycerate mutase
MKPRARTLLPGGVRLFSDPHPIGPPAGIHIANIDGASRGNPGPASYAVVLRDAAGEVVFQLAKKLGRQTNNVAEYYALLAALDFAVTHGLKALRIRSDSELLVRQIEGRYKVKSLDLKPLHERALKLARHLEYFALEHVPREMNRDADALANAALDSARTEAAENRSPRNESQPAGRAAKTRPLSTHPSAAMTRPSRRVRARFEKGVFVPIEPLDLPEGGEVTLEVHVSNQE